MKESKTLVITHSNFFADFIKNIIPNKNIVFHIVLHIVLDKGLNIKKKIIEHNPQIIILHLENFQFLDKEKIFAIHNEFKNIKLLIIGPENSNHIKYFLNNGASAYLYENATAEELLTAYKNILENKTVFSNDIAQILLKKITSEDSVLTVKESKIIDLIKNKNGYNSDEIGLKLNCSSKTVNVHKFNIKIKLNFKLNSELLRYALQS